MTQLRSDELERHLARELASLYVVHGDEPLLALEAADAIRAAARRAGCTERDVLTVDRYFDWRRLLEVNAALSLFADRKLIELRIPGGKPGAEGASALEGFCRVLATENVVLVTVPRLARSEQSAKWFAALTTAGVVVNVYPVERARLPQWIAARLARQRQRAEPDVLAFLADCVEGNLLAAHQEVQKLALLLPPGDLSLDAVREAVLDVSRHDVQALGEAMLAGDRARAVRVLDALRASGEQAPRLVWMLAEDLRTLARVQSGVQGGRSMADVLRENRVWGEPRTSTITRAAREITRSAVEVAVTHVARCERMAKGVQDGDVWVELSRLATGFARPALGRSGAAAFAR